MKVKSIFLWVLICTLGACKSRQKPILNPKVVSDIPVSTPLQVIKMETTPCYGRCPAYLVTIFDNDSLIYEGQRFVAKEGISFKKLPKGTVQGLVEQFRGANFFKFQDQYTANVSDLPTTYISFTDAGKTKRIMDYYRAPETLRKLEDLVADLVKEEVEIKEK
jgi:hypothetical protein